MIEAILDVLKVIGRGIIPPADANPLAIYWYRIRVASVACMAFCGLIASDAGAWGFVPGFDGFARASELKFVRIHILDDQLLSLQIHHCNAQSSEARIEYQRRIGILGEEYFALVGRKYDVPPCSDL